MIQSLQRRTDRIAGDVEVLKLRDELATLDRQYSEAFCRDEDGGAYKAARDLAGMMAGAWVLGAMAAVLALGDGQAGWVIAAVALFGLGGLFASAGVSAYQPVLKREKAYDRRREWLVGEIERRERGVKDQE